MTRRTGNAQIVGEDLLAIHPDDAERKGIQDGDLVRVFSARGEVCIKVKISTEVRPGVLYASCHFPKHLINIVTSSEYDEDTLCPEYKVVAVDVEKVAAAIPRGRRAAWSLHGPDPNTGHHPNRTQ